MSDMKLFDGTTGLLKTVLDLRFRNQQVIAGNLANADTPGYAPARLDFEQDLEQALSTGAGPLVTDPRHIGAGNDPQQVHGRVIRTPDRSGIGDHNGVNVDQEMINLSENQILYETATRILNKKLGLLKYVIQDGR